MPDSFVPIHERVIHYERKTESRCFLNNGWIQFDTAECHPGLRNCRIESPSISQPLKPSGLLKNHLVQFDDLVHGTSNASRQPFVEVLIFP